MTQVEAKPGESADSLWKRFKKAVERAGILSEIRKRQCYEKPSVKKKRKKIVAKKRFLKKLKKLERFKARNNNNKNFKWNKDQTKKIPTIPPQNRPDYKKRNYNNKRSFTNNPRRITKK